ncbi:hypothetical protein VTH82DRAFT_1347 [Thermothelomyces myriococcoides]
MCLTKVYYNTYADGAQDITEKSYPCRDGKRCSQPDVRRYDRKFPFARLADIQGESRRSLSERQPTPYFSGRTPRSAKSPSPSGRRDSDHLDPYTSGGGGGGGGGYDSYGYHGSSKRPHDPRDSLDSRYDRDLRLKRTVTDPNIVYVDRGRGDGASSRSRSRSSSGSRDIPLGLVPLAEEYGLRREQQQQQQRRQRRHSTSLERDDYGYSGLYYYPDAAGSSRRRTDDPRGCVVYNDDDERRRRQRREKEKDKEASSSSAAAAAAGPLPVSMMDPYRSAYLPRRGPAVVHQLAGDGSSSSSSSGRKQLRWEDQVRAQRERQNAEIASRPSLSSSVGTTTATMTTTASGDLKGILKRSVSDPWGGKSKGKARETDDEIAHLRRAIERMEIPTTTRGRDRRPRVRDEWDWNGGGIGGYGYDELELGKRSKRSRIYADDGYRY